jgi:hypothetical protein
MTPIYLWLNVAPVNAIAGDRLYPFGDAGDSPTYPYVTWFFPSSAAQNYLSEAPTMDNDLAQIDCWASNGQDALDLADAVQAEMDKHGHQRVKIIHRRDPETKSYRVQLDYSIWSHR